MLASKDIQIIKWKYHTEGFRIPSKSGSNRCAQDSGQLGQNFPPPPTVLLFCPCGILLPLLLASQ